MHCGTAAGHYHGQGDAERDRFLAGARSRNELAIVVAVMGDVDDIASRSVLSYFDSSVQVSTWFT